MPTELQKLRKEFLSAFAVEMARLGFKRSDWSFYRKTPYGRDTVSLDFISHPGLDYDVTVKAWVRHDVVEDIINEFNIHADEKSKKRIPTVGNYLGYIIGRDLRWTIAEEVDLVEVIPSIIHTVKTYAFPFFERFSSLEEVIKVTSGDDRESVHYCVLDPIRAEKAVTAAFVLGKKDVYDELVERKTPHLQKLAEKDDNNARFMQVYLALVEGLNKRWEEREKEES